MNAQSAIFGLNTPNLLYGMNAQNLTFGVNAPDVHTGTHAQNVSERALRREHPGLALRLEHPLPKCESFAHHKRGLRHPDERSYFCLSHRPWPFWTSSTSSSFCDGHVGQAFPGRSQRCSSTRTTIGRCPSSTGAEPGPLRQEEANSLLEWSYDRWEHERQIPQDKEASSSCRAFRRALSPGVSPQGDSAILSKLLEKYGPFLEATGPQAVDKFLIEGERGRGESFSSFVATKELARQEMESHLGEQALRARADPLETGQPQRAPHKTRLKGPMMRTFDEVANICQHAQTA